MSNRSHGKTSIVDRTNSNPMWRAHCAWVALRQRCNNPKNENYQSYGGRGISYDPRWNVFDNFFADMGSPPVATSLDRQNNDGPYSKENCRWVAKTHQARNRRNCKHLTFGGETKTMAEWARTLGIGHSGLIARIRRGWSIEDALSERSASSINHYSKSAEANAAAYLLGLPG